MFERSCAQNLSDAPSLIDSIYRHAMEHPDDLAFGLISQESELRERLTYRELLTKSACIASALVSLCNPGDRAILLFQGGSEFLCSFLGCLMAGVIAVPGYPIKISNNPANPSRNLERLVSIIEDSTPVVAITNRSMVMRRHDLAKDYPGFARLQWLAVEEPGDASTFLQPAHASSETAFLQYTSGSTSSPKGVMVSHGNLISMFQDMGASLMHDRSSVMVTWIPVYHDMGLIYGLLLPLYMGFPTYELLPASVLQRPLSWLQAISRYRGTHSAAPNFAFDLCSQRISNAEKENLDLSCWRSCINGAETVRPSTLRRFFDAFSVCGLREDVVRPGYGLAECTLKVTSAAAGQPSRTIRLDAETCEHGLVVPLDEHSGEEPSRVLQSCGWSHIDADIRIVNPATCHLCHANEIGEIWVNSTSVALGYWNNPNASLNTMYARLATGEGPYLRTGDLGFILDRELYIAGRLKDLIVIRGRNLYPQDIEETMEAAHPAVRTGRCCAFSIEHDDSEVVVAVAEIDRVERHSLDADAVFAKIREAVASEHEIALHNIVLVRTGTFPLTSSGKVQRRRARQEYLDETLNVVAHMRFVKEDQTMNDPHKHLRTALHAWLADFVAHQLQIQPRQVDTEQRFDALGLDSLALLELTGELERFLGLRLPDSILVDYPDVEQLCGYLAGIPSSARMTQLMIDNQEVSQSRMVEVS